MLACCGTRDELYEGGQRTEVKQDPADNSELDGLLSLDLAGLLFRYCQYSGFGMRMDLLLSGIRNGVCYSSTGENAQHGLRGTEWMRGKLP